MTGLDKHKNDFRTSSNRRGALVCRALAILCLGGFTLSFRSQEPGLSRDRLAPRPLHKISVTLDEAALEILRIEPRKHVRAAIAFDGVHFQKTQIHLKGHTSFQPIDEKPSFTLTLDDSANAHLSGQFHKFHLNNSAEDPSFLNELIGADLFRAAGVPAPQVTQALVELNGRKLGLYLLKEAFSREFLQNAFPGGAGTVYEPSQGGQIASKTDGYPLDLEHCATRVDKDAFRTFVAMELLIVHRDGYALAANNFRVYDDPVTGRVLFLPAGMDQLFGKADYPLNPHFGGELARTIFASASERAKLHAKMRELLPLLAPARLKSRIDSVLAELKPCLGRHEFNEVRTAADDLKERIARRYEFLSKNLDAAHPVLIAGVLSNFAGQHEK